MAWNISPGSVRVVVNTAAEKGGSRLRLATAVRTSRKSDAAAPSD
jgi:hypothetical protein